MEYFIRIYDSIVSNDISRSFSIVILVIFLACVLSLFEAGAGRLERVSRSGSAIMTTIGVLGTFFGIFIGLLDFDVAHLDQSVPQLLDGLKIAFGTSIVGMGGAILWRITQSIVPRPETDDVEATPEAILDTLQKINESVGAANEEQLEAMANLRRSISSDADTSLLTQIQKLRTSFQDSQRELIQEFREFARTMAENNSKALIKALEQVIRDFNTQLNEQFGENFKQLNEAVGALLAWQENYKIHVEGLEHRMEIALMGVESAETVLEEISTHTEKIPQHLSVMKKVLETLQIETDDLAAHLEGLAKLKEKAIEAFPIIEKNIKIITEDFTEIIHKSLDSSRATFEEQRSTLEKLQKGFDDLLAKSAETQRRFDEGIGQAMESMQSALTKAMQAHEQAIDNSTGELQRHVSEAWTRTQDAINKQIEALDQQMQQELTRSIETMGRSLASLSEKFVEDYGPLTDQLQKVVQMARKIQ